MMYFNERSDLNQPQYKQPENENQFTSNGTQPFGFAGHCAEQNRTRLNQIPSRESGEWRAVSALDAANNKLQELMQLLYLLGRDPAVPQDARYHVTVAQSEIALLTRLMQNAANAEADNPGPPAAAAGL
jgi:hypothetical protein